MAFEVLELSWDDPAAQALRQLQRDDILDDYGPEAWEPGPKPTSADVPFFIVVRHIDSDTLVGCGGIRPLNQHEVEVKRMYVKPEFRGRNYGVGAIILKALEEQSLRLGYTYLCLETGTRLLRAQAFYTKAGFTLIPNYGYYAGVSHSVCYGKALLRADEKPVVSATEV